MITGQPPRVTRRRPRWSAQLDEQYCGYADGLRCCARRERFERRGAAAWLRRLVVEAYSDETVQLLTTLGSANLIARANADVLPSLQPYGEELEPS